MIDRLKSSAQLYVTLDLALLAAFGTLITILRVEPTQIAETIQRLKPGIWVILGLLCSSLILERWVVLDGESIERNQKEKKLARWLFRAQTVAHVFFFCAIVSGTLGWTQADVDIRTQQTTYDSAQTLINSFIDKHHRIPRSIQDVQGLDAVRAPYWNFNGRFVPRGETTFSYNYIDSLHYQIILPGPDDVLGTSDDWERPVTVLFKTDTIPFRSK